METLVELDIEYREMAEELNLPGYYRAGTVSTRPEFINGLAAVISAHRESDTVAAEGFKSLCPDEFGRCCMRTEA